MSSGVTGCRVGTAPRVGRPLRSEPGATITSTGELQQVRHDDSRPDDDWYSGLRGGRSEQPPAGAPRHGEWSGSAGGSPADGGRRGAAEPYAGGYRHSSGGSGGYDSGGYDSGGYDSGGYDSGGYGRPEPGL